MRPNTARQLPRGPVWSGAVIAAVLGIGVLTIRLVDATPGRRAVDLLAGAALAALPMAPAALAILALRTGRRPLLIGAIELLVVAAVPLATLSPIVLLALVAWVWAWSRWPAHVPTGPTVIGLLMLAGLAAVGAVASLFIHVDPYCWQQTRTAEGGGTIQAVPPDSDSGFVWAVDTTSLSGSITAANDHLIAAGCSSDEITPAEALASLALTATAAWLVTRATPPNAAPPT